MSHRCSVVIADVSICFSAGLVMFKVVPNSLLLHSERFTGIVTAAVYNNRVSIDTNFPHQYLNTGRVKQRLQWCRE